MYLLDHSFHPERVVNSSFDQVIKRHVQDVGHIDQQIDGYTPSAKFEFSKMVRADVQFFSQPLLRKAAFPACSPETASEFNLIEGK